MTHRRHQNDWYITPSAVTEALLSVESFFQPSGQKPLIWEPACGDGAISKVLAAHGNRVWSTDLIDRGFGDGISDFLNPASDPAPFGLPAKMSSVITNPPYKYSQEFIERAIELGVQKSAWLLPLPFLASSKRRHTIFATNPPARVWVLSPRPTLWRGDEERAGSGTTEYAWFVWDKSPAKTELNWLEVIPAVRR